MRGRRLRLHRRRLVGRGQPRRERGRLAALPVPAAGARRRLADRHRRRVPRPAGVDAGRDRADGRPRPRPSGRGARDGAGRGRRRASRSRSRRCRAPRWRTIAAAAPGATRCFQLYAQVDPGRTRSLVERAAAAGYGAIVVTVDLPELGYRDRDRRYGLRPRRAPRQLPGRRRADARQPRRRRRRHGRRRRRRRRGRRPVDREEPDVGLARDDPLVDDACRSS